MLLTRLARKAIECYFQGDIYDPDLKTKQKYNGKEACFVTITKDNKLRGCIGSLLSQRPLYQDVIANAINAAFKDYRFKPLDRSEFKDIKLEVSVLTLPKELKYKNEEDLLKKTNKNIGLILTKWNRSETFLPQVWEDLPNKIDFLEQLSLKAGLTKNDWKSAQYKYYKVKKHKEK